MTSVDPRLKPGRPPRDVSEQVYAHISGELAKGRSLSETARARLIVYDGRGKIIRKLSGNHLEAAYREAKRDRVMPWERPTSGYKHSWPTFMGRRLPTPIATEAPPEGKRGRLKKNRQR